MRDVGVSAAPRPVPCQQEMAVRRRSGHGIGTARRGSAWSAPSANAPAWSGRRTGSDHAEYVLTLRRPDRSARSRSEWRWNARFRSPRPTSADPVTVVVDRRAVDDDLGLVRSDAVLLAGAVQLHQLEAVLEIAQRRGRDRSAQGANLRPAAPAGAQLPADGAACRGALRRARGSRGVAADRPAGN